MDIIFWSSLPTRFGFVQRYLGPYQLGFWLEQQGYSYQVIDFIQNGPLGSMPVDELVAITEKFITPQTKVIGLSSTFFYIQTANKVNALPDVFKEAMDIIKSKYPFIKFVLGGNKAELYTSEDTNLFDAVVVGLAEDVMLELLKFYDNKSPEPKSRRLLQHKTKFYYADDVIDKKFDIQTSRHIWSDKDCIMPGESLPLELSRGCIFKCKFCQYPLLGRSKYDYTRSMECVREELVYNYEKWGVTNYYLLDDTFNDTVQKVQDFYEMTKTLPFKIQYATYLRADLLHRFPETIPWLKDSGLIGAFFGIETFHVDASKSIGKGWSSKSKEFLLWLVNTAWQNKVVVHFGMIAGIPGESVESILESATWLKANDIHTWNFKSLGIAKYNGHVFASEYAKEAEKYGFTWPDPDNIYAWYNTKTKMSYKTAIKLEKFANSMRAEHTRTHLSLEALDSWCIMSLLTLGHNISDIVQDGNRWSNRWINRKILKEKGKQWLEDYKTKLNNIADSMAPLDGIEPPSRRS